MSGPQMGQVIPKGSIFKFIETRGPLSISFWDLPQLDQGPWRGPGPGVQAPRSWDSFLQKQFWKLTLCDSEIPENWYGTSFRKWPRDSEMWMAHVCWCFACYFAWVNAKLECKTKTCQSCKCCTFKVQNSRKTTQTFQVWTGWLSLVSSIVWARMISKCARVLCTQVKNHSGYEHTKTDCMQWRCWY